METDVSGCASITWDTNGEPVSQQFGDVYFAKEQGLDESRYIFIGQNDLPERFAALADNAHFIIGETGFGTGLNFLATLELWRCCAPASARLHFISAELYPLNHADLRRALGLWPQLAPYADELLKVYPPILQAEQNSGYFRLNFASNVQLTLIFADATKAFSQFKPDYLGPSLLLEQQHLGMGGRAFAVDAWFLDGFAPAKNPSMWQGDLFAALANLSRPGTTLATFTAAALVKRGLEQAGFSWQKQRGFGRKRDMLTAVCLPFSRYFPHRPQHHHQYQQQWPLTKVHQARGKQVLVIGAGMAGCHSAFALAQRGFNVTLAESETVAGAGSGNAQGIVYATLSHTTGPFADFNLAAFLFACTFYRVHEFFARAGAQCGLLDLYSDPVQLDRLTQRFSGNEHWLQTKTAEQASALAGVDIFQPGLFYPASGWLNPQQLCRQLIDHRAIRLVEQQPITQLHYINQQWQCDLGRFDQVIIAAAQQSVDFESAQAIKIKAIRGQVTAVEPVGNLACVLCGDGYIAPAQNGIMHTGASFNPKSASLEILLADQAKNLANAAVLSPAFAHLQPIGDRAGLRCVTPDYLPIVGPLPTPEFLLQFKPYSSNRWAYIDAPAAYYPQLFMITGLGSRGLTYSPIAAEVIASLITGEPLPLSPQLWKFIHPARFWVRDLIRGILPNLP